MTLFSDRRRGSQVRDVQDVTHGCWRGLVALIQSRVSDGSFGQNFPEQCPDGNGITGVDERMLADAAAGHDVPWPPPEGEPPTERVFDLLEFCFRNIAQVSIRGHHSFYGHSHLAFDVTIGRAQFREAVNQLLARNRLAYDMDEEGRMVPVAASPEVPPKSEPAASTSPPSSPAGPSVDPRRLSPAGAVTPPRRAFPVPAPVVLPTPPVATPPASPLVYTPAPLVSSPITLPSTTPIITFPPPLVEAYKRDRLAVLFGSGLSIAGDVVGNFPRWKELPERLISEAARHGVLTAEQASAKRAYFRDGDLSLEKMLAELDTLKIALRGARKYQHALNALFRPKDAVPGDVHRALLELQLRILATTNYDELYEHVEGPPVRKAYTWKEADKVLSDIEDERRVLFKVHGTAESEESVVMTSSEYNDAAKHATYQRVLSHILQEYTFLLVGYGMNDPFDLDLVFLLNASSFGSVSRSHYVLMKDVSPSESDRWQREHNVHRVRYEKHEDLPAILRALRATKT